jgi:CubicO group peptidase (beta-lactamase class C family)
MSSSSRAAAFCTRVRSVTGWKWALPGALLAAALLGGAPWVWRLSHGLRGAVDGEGGRPRELIAGGNEAPAPRVAPELELLERSALEAAAAYAGEHDSRALIVSRHEHIVFERYWRGTGFDTPADAQSFTPLLAALATGVAISHRLIGWPDQPLGSLLDEWRQDPRGNITVRDLLLSRSGLAPPPGPGGNLAARLLAAPIASPPGTRRVDQGGDPQLLALVIERATKQRFAAYLSRVLWRRIGAADAWLEVDRPGGAALADCCLRAHQGDWIRIAQLLLREGNYRGVEIVRPSWVRLMRTPAKADPAYGAYLRIASTSAPGQEPYALPDVFAVAGAGGNRMWLVPSLQIAIVCTGEPAGRDARWDDARIANLIIRGARDYRPPAARPGADVSALVPSH